MTLPIVKAPNEILETVCDPLTDEELKADHIKILAGEMIRTMVMNGGAGLAAPQVGVTKRLFVMKVGNGAEVFFNPEITRRGRDTVKDVEGCLSIPGKRVRVERARICEVTYTDIMGTRKTMKLKNHEARCAQHEMDHLDGILIA